MALHTIDADRLTALYREHVAALQDAYASALERAGLDALVIHSGVAARQSIFDDQYWPHKPTPAFAHWLPLRKSGAALVIQGGKQARLIHATNNDYWDSEAIAESDHFWTSFEQVEVDGDDKIAAELPRARAAFIGEDRAQAQAWGLADAYNPAELLRELDQVRTRKTDYERACMAEASRRAALGHQAVHDAFMSGDPSELELHLLYLRKSGQDESHTPYQNIVAIDENAAVLHHVHYRSDAPANKTQSILIDAGATCLGYACDITRTAIKDRGGEGAAVFAALIRGVEALQAEICRNIRVGLNYEELHDQSHRLLADVLRDIGVSSASSDALVESGATRAFFPHGLGHSLGIQVHDVGCRERDPRPDNPFLRNTSDIEPGQVFTIEPGCYFIAPLMAELRTRDIASSIDWGAVDVLAGFGGVRIEDNIAVMDDGTVNLTRDNWPDTP